MTIKWNFNEEDVKDPFAPVEPGKYMVKIINWEEKKSKSGRDMIEITLQVSGNKKYVSDYLVFLPEDPAFTNSKIKQLMDSFGIKKYTLEKDVWVDKVGAASIKIDENDYNKVSYYIPKFKQMSMRWEEPGAGNRKTIIKEALNDDEEVPF